MGTTYSLRDYDGDLVMVGPGMDAERYQVIKAGLPADVRERVIGWKRIGR